MNGELDGLRVHGECAVGWDAMAPPNEVVDEYGHPAQDPGFGEPDPRAPTRRVYDAPEVRALREYLRTNNGFRGLEICSPDEVTRAARIYRRDGFVVVRDLLDARATRLYSRRLRRGACRDARPARPWRTQIRGGERSLATPLLLRHDLLVAADAAPPGVDADDRSADGDADPDGDLCHRRLSGLGSGRRPLPARCHRIPASAYRRR